MEENKKENKEENVDEVVEIIENEEGANDGISKMCYIHTTEYSNLKRRRILTHATT